MQLVRSRIIISRGAHNFDGISSSVSDKPRSRSPLLVAAQTRVRGLNELVSRAFEEAEEPASWSSSLKVCRCPFMFRSKRNALVKRLWKHRLGQHHETSGAMEDDDLALKSVAYSMLKRLKEVQLELLVQSVESKGGDTSTACVLVPKGEVRIGRRSLAPNLLCCKLLRWPDLKQPFELKRLASCQPDQHDSVYICCNPYHWSRLCKPESPPPPYSRFALERLKPEDRAPSEPVSLETGGTNQYGSLSSQQTGGFDGANHVRWCNIAYWELRNRVGRLFPVCKSMVHVFSDLPHGDGFSLGALAEQNEASCPTVRRTRDKIGFGLTLSQEADGVWVYNRSEHAIFVNSPTLTGPNVRSLATVYKVLPGYSVKIFDYAKSLCYQALQDPEMLDGPYDPNSVRISFAKGWGPKYSRQVITSCPCWLEVLLVPR